ncbi:MAG: glycosyltransferase family 1 protein [Ilumatobacteraceae bacterium]
MGEPAVLVDARPVAHPTAGGRGIGNYTLGLLHGLVAAGADVTALVGHPDDAIHLTGVPPTSIEVLHRDVLRRAAPGSWYVATGLFLHPIPFDPIPAGVTEAGFPIAAVMYDVIPYRRPDLYLGEENAARQARLRAALARTVDVHVAISAFSASTAVAELGLDPRRMHVIGAGVDARFVPPAQRAVRRPTVVAVTGADPRKNTDRLVRAWSQVSAGLRGSHRLVVVAGVGPALAARWSSLASELGCGDGIEVVTDATDDDMVRLLQQAALVVQPSIEEGFGLPVAEAAACGAVVICSNRSALPEVLDEPEATFDPTDPRDIAQAIERALTDPTHRAVLAAAAARAAPRWQWEEVARRLQASIARHPVRERRPLATRQAVVERAPAAGPLVATSLRDQSTETITALVDRTHESIPVFPMTERPASAFGRYVKYHEFDQVLTVLDDDTASITNRIARRWPTHAWSRSGRLDPRVVATSRSLIVATPGALEGDDACDSPRPPVLVLPEPAGTWTDDDVARALVWWLDHGFQTDDAVTVVGPTDTLA